MAKRTTVKRTKRDGAPARRGGRKPGTWTLVNPEQLKTYRTENKISRARLAQILGVSSTSVQNWESGTVATTKIQQRLADLIAAGPAALPPVRRPPSLWDAAPADAGVNHAVLVTGNIVATFVQTRKAEISTGDLVTLIRSVRAALS